MPNMPLCIWPPHAPKLHSNNPQASERILERTATLLLSALLNVKSKNGTQRLQELSEESLDIE
ncbi:hypothetical protein OUZ56_015942 [Daphnia magna]|uniref:Uncharacterized protein n=1 Tax=Daphnia magna TaxID=35525 RepID=A0ABR0AP69_9CRUS|nr:hypothetical protein OUZ56_015942 [Daphnia magna]